MFRHKYNVHITGFLLACSTVVIFYGIFLLNLSNTNPLSIEGVDQGCYHLYSASDQTLLGNEELARRKCNRTLPDFIIAGAKKCGTTALRNFLTFHPQLATAKCETHFYDSRYYLGFDWYLNQMPYSTPDQLTLEKTPSYFVHPLSPPTIRKDLDPRLRIIFILRDPVQRAISDYAHLYEARAWAESGFKKETFIPDHLTREQLLIRAEFKKIRENEMKPLLLKETFEDSVLFPNGTVNTQTSIIDTGIYIKHIRRWFSFFPSEQFLILDGEEFIYNPLPALKKVEDFLKLKQYFTKETFYFDTDKTFFCLAQPIRSCLKNQKGRPHPYVERDILRYLYNFFEPYNIELQSLLQLNFTWTIS